MSNPATALPDMPLRVRGRTRSRRLGVQRPDRRLTKLVIAITFFSIITPNDLSLPTGGLFLSPLRLAALLALVPLVFALIRRMVHGVYVPVASDALIVATVIWMIVAMSMNHSIDVALGNPTAVGIELLVGYLAARVFMGHPAAFDMAARTLVVVVAIAVVLAFTDTLTGQHTISRLSAMPFGGVRAEGAQFRFGVIRARGVFEHTILFGAFLSGATVLILVSGIAERLKRIGVGFAVFGLLIALSSAPIIALVLAVGLLAYDWLFNRFAARWHLFFLMAASGLLLVFLVVENPIPWLIARATLDPATGYYRLLIWEWGWQNILTSPWTGIGLSDWFRPRDMSATVDTVWLLHAMRYGLVGVALLLLSALSSTVVLTSRRLRQPSDPAADRIRFGLNVMLFILLFVGMTVHFWGTLWIFFGIVLGLRAAFAEERFLPREATTFPGLAPMPGRVAKGTNRPVRRRVPMQRRVA